MPFFDQRYELKRFFKTNYENDFANCFEKSFEKFSRMRSKQTYQKLHFEKETTSQSFGEPLFYNV